MFQLAGEHISAVSSQDSTIASLKASISELQKQVDTLSTLVAMAADRAKEALSQNHRTIALAALRSKKLKEKTLTQRAESLSQIEEILGSIERAADQVTMVKIMKESTTVLQDLQKEIGDIDTVQDVVEQLKEETQKVDEVGRVIEGAREETSAIDEEEIEGELEAMLKEANGQKDEMKELEGLNVPSKLALTTDTATEDQQHDAPVPPSENAQATQSAETANSSRTAFSDLQVDKGLAKHKAMLSA